MKLAIITHVDMNFITSRMPYMTSTKTHRANMENFKIFLSYSWDSEDHKDWTLRLANELEEYFEINVTLDQYDLDSLSDKNHFMEKGVFENEFVLAIITNKYVEKANLRTGGVGIETKMSSSRHWEESLAEGKSNIIPILREGDTLPNYLKEKIYIDFRNDEGFESSFAELLAHFTGSTKRKRPRKTKSIHRKPVHRDLTKIEDFLKINHKRRKLVFDKSETTDFSSGNRIKFELWETKSPSTDYYLFIFDGVTLRPTIQKLCQLVKRDGISFNHLTVLRSSKSERGYIEKLFKENGVHCQIEDITFSDYIWNYCIDEDAKLPSNIYKQRFFIDQPLISLEENNVSKGPAFEYLKKELNAEAQSTAKVIIAPGGTGKTTLCQYVASEYQNPKSAISVLIQSEELRESGKINGYENVKIKSVYDLYEMYSQVLSEQGDAHAIYDKSTFEVALITGRLVLVIDGMDEIISLFPEGFDLNLFLKSIEELNNQLAACKILITSRNDVFPIDLIEKYKNLDKYCLLGFDEGACEKYLSQRFKHLQHRELLKKKVLNNIRPLIKTDEKQRILPFVVDLLSSLAEDSNEDEENINIDLSFEGKPYESNEEITDYLVYSVLRREWQRQKINIPITDVLEIFLEISSAHKDSFSKSDFEDLVSIFCNEETDDLVVKMLRNPLLIVEGEYCRFKYDFISDYFKSLYIINSINSGRAGEDFIKLAAKNAYGDSEVISGVVKYFSSPSSNAFVKCSTLINKIKAKILPADITARNDINFKAISFLVWVATLSNPCQSKSGFTNQIATLLGEEFEFKNLAIYGNNNPMDLEGITLLDSKFVGYKNFSKSNFTGSNIKNCFFESCYNSSPSKSLRKDIFDSCRLGDLEIVIESSEEKSEKDRAILEQELRAFFSSFFHRGAFKDQKFSYVKMSKRVRSINRGFFDKLVKRGVLEIKAEKSDETYYMISNAYQDSVYGFLSNNKIDRKIEVVFSLL